MNSNKFFLLAGASLMAGVLCVFSAMAEAPHPEKQRAYESLTAIELREAKQPKFKEGMHDLSKKEARYQEQLPMQLQESIKTISARKYKPSASHRSRL